MSIRYTKNFQKTIRSVLGGKAAAIIAPVASELHAKIKAATPVLTGETKDSIKLKKHSDFGYTIYTESEAARHIEKGTEDTLAVHMFGRTFDNNAVAMAKRLENDFKAHIEKNATS
jgi:hypothetical protein